MAPFPPPPRRRHPFPLLPHRRGDEVCVLRDRFSADGDGVDVFEVAHQRQRLPFIAARAIHGFHPRGRVTHEETGFAREQGPQGRARPAVILSFFLRYQVNFLYQIVL